MSERKNIDKLFQEKFKDFEANPPENAWPELEKRLKKKKDRKAIPIWWRLSGVAAALLLGLLVADQMGLFGHGNAATNEVVVEDAPKGKPENNGNNSDLNLGNPDSNGAVAEKDSAVSVANPTESAVAESSGNTKTNNRPENTNSNGGQQHYKNTAPFNGYQKNNADRAVVNASTDSKNSGTKRLKKQKNKTDVSTGTANERLNETTKNQTAVAQNEKSKAEKSTVNNNGNQVKKEAVLQNQTNKNNENAVADHTHKNSEKSADKGTVVKKDAIPQNPNEKNSRETQPNTAIAHQNTTDNKSSEAATVTRAEGEQAGGNQKTQFNRNNNTTDKPINQVAAVEDPKQVKKLDSTAVAMTVPNALEELLNEKENKVTKEPKLNRWQITSNIAPIYFGSTSGGSPIDSTFANKSKDYNTQMGYGIGVNYAVNKRLTIRAGVNKVSLDYDTNNVELYASLDQRGLENLDGPGQNNYLNFGKVMASRSAEMTSGARSEMALNSGPLETDKFSGTITQKMGYIEVPVEMSYAIINRKFGVNVIAGVSTLFLNENEVMLSSEGLSTNLGEASNLNKTHFSTNVGLGVKYAFLKSFEARFEPIFKYQLNTFNKDSGDFKPYFFGLYTGVSFRF